MSRNNAMRHIFERICFQIISTVYNLARDHKYGNLLANSYKCSSEHAYIMAILGVHMDLDRSECGDILLMVVVN